MAELLSDVEKHCCHFERFPCHMCGVFCRRLGIPKLDELAHKCEHSIEFQLPIIQYIAEKA